MHGESHFRCMYVCIVPHSSLNAGGRISHTTHKRNMFAESKPSNTQQGVLSTPQILPPVVEKPVIQEIVPPALNGFRQKKSTVKERLKLVH